MITLQSIKRLRTKRQTAHYYKSREIAALLDEKIADEMVAEVLARAVR